MKNDKLLKQITISSILLLCFVMMFSAYIYGAEPGLAGAEPVHSDSGDTVADEQQRNTSAPDEAILPELTLTPVSTDMISPVPELPSLTPEPTVLPVVNLSDAWQDVEGAGHSEVYYHLTSRTIILEKKPGYENAKLELTELPVTRQIRVEISSIMGEALADEHIKRVSEDIYYHGTPPTPTPTMTLTPTPRVSVTPTPRLTELSPTPTYAPENPYYPWRYDVVHAITSKVQENEDGSITQTLLLTLDKTYVYRVYEDEWNFYISLVRPKDVYDRIVVIDAGHGGIDPGTSSNDNKYTEKAMNLSMVLYLKELLDQREDIKVYYTRETDVKPSLQERVNLANDVEADFFLSIHCNANNAKSLNGTEVLYNSMQNKWTGMNSKQFALLCLEELNEHVGLKNNGIVARDHNVTIVKEARMPVALVETAYMSNPSDMETLAKEETRRAVAQSLYDAILRAYEMMEEQQEEEENPK